MPATNPASPEKIRGTAKTARLPIKFISDTAPRRKPPWLRVRFPGGAPLLRVKEILRRRGLHTVCEEAACPNLGECFSAGTATFMILGDVCTRRCPFCDVAHGRPLPPDAEEASRLAEAVLELGLRYVVITSVDRDDLLDGGAEHFAHCIRALRQRCPSLHIEILTPDFRGREELALRILGEEAPDVFNHNLETVPRLYAKARPGADYHGSLRLLQRFKKSHPALPTKSGLMLGLGESRTEVLAVLRDLRTHDVDMLTLGQYLSPGRGYLPVEHFIPPEEFRTLGEEARAMGFRAVASAPLVRSSYHADMQTEALL